MNRMTQEMQSALQAQDQGQDAPATHESGIGFQPMNRVTQKNQSALQEQDQGQDAPATINIRRGAYLPHWTRDGATYSVTFRLADSLPQGVLIEYKVERDALLKALKQNKGEPTRLERRAQKKLFSQKIDQFLDAGTGACWMNNPAIADIVANAMKHFDGQRYHLHAWCVMPNHVHAVLQPLPGHTLDSILHSWKSYTANQANKILKRTCAFWHPEPYDHLIRDEDDYNHAIAYTLNNPQSAGLKSWRWAECGTGFQPVKDDS